VGKKKIRRDKKVEVILEKTVPKLGLVGEVVKVADGYARNFLLPQGIAKLATPHMQMVVAKRVKHVREQELQEQEIAQSLATQLSEVTLNFEVKASEDGKLFGSVSATDIAKALKEKGFELDKKHIHLDEPMKELGVYTVPLKLHAMVQTEIKAWVIRESNG
jgi:large subunit ribosomal protein L9